MKRLNDYLDQLAEEFHPVPKKDIRKAIILIWLQIAKSVRNNDIITIGNSPNDLVSSIGINLRSEVVYDKLKEQQKYYSGYKELIKTLNKYGKFSSRNTKRFQQRDESGSS